MGLNERGLYDIYGMWYQPFWQTKIFFIVSCIIITLLVLSLIGFLVYRYYKKHKKKIPAWQRALNEINHLKQQKVTTKEYGKQFYGEISVIFKTYLHSRYGFDVCGKTDYELMCCLKKQQFPKNLVANIEDIVNGGQLVKFAGQRALQKVIDRHLILSESVIKQTIPKQ